MCSLFRLAVRPFRLVVAVDAQSGQAISVPSPFQG